VILKVLSTGFGFIAVYTDLRKSMDQAMPHFLIIALKEEKV
jgi:hypothetical protein